MRILYIGRLFSGLESSLVTQRWDPTGAPTIFKLIEALDAGPHDLRLVLTCKDGTTTWTDKEDKILLLEGLNTQVRVIAGVNAFPVLLGRLRTPLRELCQVWKLWKEVKVFKPDVIYLGNANIWSGGLLARLGKTPVVFRMMGVYPAMRNALKGFRPAHIVMRWCFSAPYSAAICTQDGSGIEQWLDEALSPSVQKYMWINGVDTPPSPNEIPPTLRNIPPDKTIILFIGHLEQLKGCDTYVDAVVGALAQRPGQIHALLIGTGSRLEVLKEKIDKADQSNNFTFIDRLPHTLIAEAHRRADIYISLNRLGNLSNANLEAMKLGQCIVLPRAQTSLGIDVITQSMIPQGAVSWIRDADDKEGLVNAILKLHDSPEARKNQCKEMATVAQRIIPSWGERIKMEITLLEQISAGK